MSITPRERRPTKKLCNVIHNNTFLFDSGQSVTISVIICARNASKTIERQLTALSHQENCPAFELIIINHRSTDNTISVITEWSTNHDHGSIVRLIVANRNTKNTIPYARNEGISLATGDLLLFCDADDAVDNEWVHAFASRRSQYDAAAGLTVPTIEDEYHPATALIQSEYLRYTRFCNLAIHRSVFAAIGGCDESLPRYGFEDIDLCWRLQESGYALNEVKEAVVHQTVSESKTAIIKHIRASQARILMAHRYKQYDNRPYSISYCLRDFLTSTLHFLRAAMRHGELRSTSINVVHAWGRLMGATYYSFKGYPKPLVRQFTSDSGQP